MYTPWCREGVRVTAGLAHLPGSPSASLFRKGVLGFLSTGLQHGHHDDTIRRTHLGGYI